MAPKIHKNKKLRARPGDLLGRLKLIQRVKKPAGYYGDIWLVECLCGSPRFTVKEQYLFRNPNPKRHCGCLSKGLPTLHPKEYNSWQAMHGRCYRTDHVSYEHYGGRGIKVCARWLSTNPAGFANFLNDMGPRPKGTQLDRFPDVDGHYTPGNCRWATATQQAWNKRSHKHAPPRPPIPDISDLIDDDSQK